MLNTTISSLTGAVNYFQGEIGRIIESNLVKNDLVEKTYACANIIWGLTTSSKTLPYIWGSGGFFLLGTLDGILAVNQKKCVHISAGLAKMMTNFCLATLLAKQAYESGLKPS